MSAKMARGQNSARRQPPGWRDRLRGYVLQHRSHCRDSLRRLLAEPMATLMIWSMVGIALALPSGLYLLLDNLKQVSEGWSEGSRRITLYLKPGLSNDVDLPFNAHNVRVLRDWCGCFSPTAFESYLTAPVPSAEEPPAGDPQP